MKFPNKKAIHVFRDDEELTERRREASAVIQSGAAIPISEDYFSNYPDVHTKH